MPLLYVLGGANGVGKTTWYQTGVQEGHFQDLPFINIDNIAKIELGGYNDENLAAAEQIARARMSDLIQQKNDFLIESNLAKSSDYEWIDAMRKHGYQTLLYFLSTNDVNINKSRVTERVIEGGHDIPDNIIEHRYTMGLIYLKSQILKFDEVKLIDVSTENALEMASLQNGKVIFKIDQPENWVVNCISIAEKLMLKSQG